MKYKLFLSKSIEVLKEEELIGEANTYQGACKEISKQLKERGVHQEKYWRFLMNENATFIDFGSYSKYAAIVPPVPMGIITGDIEETEE